MILSNGHVVAIFFYQLMFGTFYEGQHGGQVATELSLEAVYSGSLNDQ